MEFSIKEAREAIKSLREAQAAPQRVGSPSNKKQGIKRKEGGSFYIQKRRGEKTRPKPNRHQRKRALAEAFGLIEKTTVTQRWAGDDAAKAERARQRKAGGKSDEKVIKKTAARAAQRSTPEFRENPKASSKEEFKKKRSKTPRTNMVKSASPSMKTMGYTKPGSESRKKLAKERLTKLKATLPKKKLP